MNVSNIVKANARKMAERRFDKEIGSGMKVYCVSATGAAAVQKFWPVWNIFETGSVRF